MQPRPSSPPRSHRAETLDPDAAKHLAVNLLLNCEALAHDDSPEDMELLIRLSEAHGIPLSIMNSVYRLILDTKHEVEQETDAQRDEAYRRYERFERAFFVGCARRHTVHRYVVHRGRAPRRGCNTRARGSRRSAARRASRGSPSDDPDESAAPLGATTGRAA
jgi:hypothetical protein